MQKMNRADRAKIFSPFAAIKGFEEALHKKEKILVEKRNLSEEEIDELNNNLTEVKKGDMVKAVYYKDGEYLETTGLVAHIDKVLLNLTIVNQKILFEDLLVLEILK